MMTLSHNRARSVSLPNRGVQARCRESIWKRFLKALWYALSAWGT